MKFTKTDYRSIGGMTIISTKDLITPTESGFGSVCPHNLEMIENEQICTFAQFELMLLKK